MVADDEQDEKEFGMHPAVARADPDAIAQVQPHAERNGHDGQDGGETIQPAGHAQQRRLDGRVRLLRQIHEDARQIEQSGEPGGDEDYMEGLDPKHGHGAIRSRKAALYAAMERPPRGAWVQIT
ncbi:hypothetical protein D3C71_1128640 [compost metagenome]